MKPIRIASLARALIAAIIVVSTHAIAADPLATPDYSGSFWSRSTMTGDWGGERQQLANKGVTVDMTLVQVYQGVLTGGLDESWRYGGRENISLNVDTQKLGLWPGGFLFVEGEGNFGEFAGPARTGAIIPVNANQVFPTPDTPSFDMPAVQYMQFLSHQFGLFAGKIEPVTTGDLNEFAHGKGDEGFLNLSFCFNPVLLLTVPYSALGAGAVVLPTSDYNKFIITAAALDSEGNAGTSGFDTAFKGGTSFILSGRYTTGFFGLTGHQLLLGTYSDRVFTDLNQKIYNFIIPALPIEQRAGSWAVDYNFDQFIYQPDPKEDRGIGIFGRFGASDGVANPIRGFYSAGVGAKGLFGRRDDSFGIGYFYMQTANANIPDRLNFRDSQGVEAYYEFAITPWAHFTPDIQVIRPSQARVDTSVVLSVRLELKF